MNSSNWKSRTPCRAKTKMNELNYRTRVMLRINARECQPNGWKFQHTVFGVPRNMRQLCNRFCFRCSARTFPSFGVTFSFEPRSLARLLDKQLYWLVLPPFFFWFACFAHSWKQQKLWILKYENMFFTLKHTSESHFRLTWTFMLMCTKQYTIWNDSQSR